MMKLICGFVLCLGFRLYGKHFSKIVNVIPTKSEAHIASLYVAHGRKYQLDGNIKQHQFDSFSEEMDITS